MAIRSRHVSSYRFVHHKAKCITLYRGISNKKEKVPRGYWANENNQRMHLDMIGRELGVKQMDDWYKVSAQEVRKRATFIGDYHNNSLPYALEALYPEHKWDIFRFASLPKGFWTIEDNQREFLTRIGRELGVKELDDWYKVPRKEAQQRATFIFDYYKGSLFQALQKLYPHHNWNADKFIKPLSGHYTDEINQRNRLEAIGKELGVKVLDDWYNVSQDEVRKRANFIHDYYNNSILLALEKLYPEHKWDPIRFATVPRGYWLKESTQKEYHDLFMKWQQKYNIKELKDWYQLPPRELELFQRASRGIFGSITKMLEEWFPSTNWSAEVQASSPELDLQVPVFVVFFVCIKCMHVISGCYILLLM
jgi:hypothetical protein